MWASMRETKYAYLHVGTLEDGSTRLQGLFGRELRAGYC